MLYRVYMSYSDLNGSFYEEWRSFTATSQDDAIKIWKESFLCYRGESWLSKGEDLIAHCYNGEISK